MKESGPLNPILIASNLKSSDNCSGAEAGSYGNANEA